MRKKALAMLLCTAMATALLACTPAGNTPTATPTDEPTEQPTAEPTVTEPEKPVVENGILCLTFDDRNFYDWLKMLPLFKQYNAHATFFFFGQIDDEAISVMKKLQEEGHSIGLHTLNHDNSLPGSNADAAAMEAYYLREIAPQLEKCQENGIEISGFAYPFNIRHDAADEYLSQYFGRFRAGDENATEEQIFIPLEDLKGNPVMRGIGLGEYYNTTEADTLATIEKIAEKNACGTFFSHAINRVPGPWDMTPELLESMLKKADELGVKMMGFADLADWLEN